MIEPVDDEASAGDNLVRWRRLHFVNSGHRCVLAGSQQALACEYVYGAIHADGIGGHNTH